MFNVTVQFDGSVYYMAPINTDTYIRRRREYTFTSLEEAEKAAMYGKVCLQQQCNFWGVQQMGQVEIVEL